MNINNLIKQAHETAREKGFYDCPECDGDGCVDIIDARQLSGFHQNTCHSCNGTGKKDRDISELIVLVIRELYEALEAHRSGKFADMKNYKEDLSEDGIDSFFIHIKNTLEDELADVLIRLFDMMGYLGIENNCFHELPEAIAARISNQSFSENILYLNDMILDLRECKTSHMFTLRINSLIYFCKQQNIDIETHIKLKMEYNKTREYRHGKRY